MSYRANVYILSLIEYDKQEIVLNRDQLNLIESRIDAIVTSLKGEREDQIIYSPYKVWRLPKSIFEPKYLFRWEEFPEKDNGKLIEYLAQKFGIDWVKNAKVEKIYKNNTIKISSKKNSLLLKLNDEKTEVILEIDDISTNKFIAKLENGELNIYESEEPKIEQVTLGYYHHRIILSISVEFTKSSFENLREMRDIFHTFFKENIVKDLRYLRVDKCRSSGQECTIRFIYSYPLFVVENGNHLMEYGSKYADTIYSDATTAFLFKIPDSSIIPRNHFVRVSIPFTLLYSSGEVGKELFWNIINAIYFGGLYKKKSKDREEPIENPINEFDEEILVDLSRLMLGNVSQTQFSLIDMNFRFLAILIAISALIISIITLVISIFR